MTTTEPPDANDDANVIAFPNNHAYQRQVLNDLDELRSMIVMLIDLDHERFSFPRLEHAAHCVELHARRIRGLTKVVIENNPSSPLSLDGG